MENYLDATFLARVRRTYRLALASCGETGGMWGAINVRRRDIHAALLAESDEALRAIFADPVGTDLYYGMDCLCRSISGPIQPSSFVDLALSNHRATLARYQIERLIELIGSGRGGSVIEIGPGMGRAAFYGYRDGLDYTTIDLPLGIVGQACFLGAALGADKLWLQGDDDLPSAGRIKILFGKPDRRFDIVLNVDSLTEMPAPAALGYMRWLSQHATIFLSINHKNNLFTVDEAAHFAGGWRRDLQRECPAWPGYTEEVFSARRSPVRFFRTRQFALHNLTRIRSRLRNHGIVTP